ncbi:MAG: hypothetical protein BGO12_07690 [Verrucomicrobia bacterium 61-8]|nr:MAG: hypothetical protein BGO12_07690 [Verrucomicrobia bacterium 61-8]
MKHLIIAAALLISLIPLRAAEQPWSEPENGMRARLSLESQKDSPFLKVYIEFQNTSGVAGMRKIRFNPQTIHAKVVNKNGDPLHTPIGAYDGTAPLWEPLLLPYEGTIKFNISFPGMGYRQDQNVILIDLGPEACWAVPNDQDYFLSAVLTIPKQEGDHPHFDWSGTLDLPKVRIPTK